MHLNSPGQRTEITHTTENQLFHAQFIFHYSGEHVELWVYVKNIVCPKQSYFWVFHAL